ncbi:hypothetical protein [Thiorhodovibrio frisius]|uniref:Uncharacterized protein n=1 Tax=Thiorhodovibrio frisius TaxID=631362 RepID=H8Z2W3_9GAMM|nr:hypothetical protein [Thiorhodovibrio frisius]EIC21699.1 hypothetical protein Thi970DRAFT_01922 [Thiorhodovibrio frisius]WPL21667.1 hypothetical protein Thiofri_01795 [Thiorhodovibrio frisius]
MHIFDADPSVVRDLKDESTLILEKSFEHFSITALRHPTMGKLVLVEDRNGGGAVVETEH